MTTPPPGPWPTPPPGPGQQPPSWGSQPPWGPPPQRGGNRAKWILGGIALVVVIGLTVVATLLVTRDDSGSGEPTASAPPTTSADTSDIASADDRGPIGIITEDPTCAAWGPIVQKLSEEQDKGWRQVDRSVPASDWTSSQRVIFEKAATDMAAAADQAEALVARTPHRVMRELYSQTISYWRAYAAAIGEYGPNDDHLATAASGFSNSVNWICGAIAYGSALARSQLLPPGMPPQEVALPELASNPARFLSEADASACGQWQNMVSDYRLATSEWMQKSDPALPSSQWSPEQQTLFANMVTVMRENASTMQQIALTTKNSIWIDFAALAATYRRAYVQAIPTYMPADNYLDSAATELMVAIDEACQATGA